LGGLLEKIGWQKTSPILLAASTHPGEEKAISEVCQKLQAKIPQLRLILVPRHAERAVAVIEELGPLGVAPMRRSSLANADLSAATGPLPCLLVDSTGELRAWQHLATVVVIGKSFLGVGGQNPVEAISAGKPVLFGPHMENFDALVSQLLAAQAAIQVPDFDGLQEHCAKLLSDPTAAAQMAEAGRTALAEHEGATKRTADVLLGEAS
jgi:3-deoxy-D-manno-octulosonic-acid transferase